MSLTLGDLINQSLEKIKKAITKKQYQLKQLIDETLQVKEYNNANHLMKVYQQCIESKQVKLIELALFDIKNIVEQGFLDGEQIIGEKRVIEIQTRLLNLITSENYFHEISIFRIENLSIPLEYSRKPKKFEYVIVTLDFVMQTQLEKEEIVQINMIQAIQAIMTNRKHPIFGEAVTRVFSLLINLHSVSKVVAIITASKEACQKIVNTYFARLEDFGILAEDEYQQAIQQQCNQKLLVFGKCKAQINAEQYRQNASFLNNFEIF